MTEEKTEATLYFGPKKPEKKCKNCGRPKSHHKAHTFNCPMGRKHRTHGYSCFNASSVWWPR